MEVRLWCGTCNSPRKGEVCQKCQSPTFVPVAEWEYPKTPDVDRIREIAYSVGYAIGEHGSKERDLDLIAVPWVAEAVSPAELITLLCEQLDARFVDSEDKALGRHSVCLQLNGWYKNIDLSITPRA